VTLGIRLPPAARWLLLAIALLSFLPDADAGDSAAAPKPVVHTINIEAVGFSPQTLTVRAGDVVEWVNKDPFPHSATAEGGAFDSKSIDAGKSWRFTTKAKGEFPYVCTFHPTMKAILIVK
jgi:plastocyanin